MLVSLFYGQAMEVQVSFGTVSAGLELAQDLGVKALDAALKVLVGIFNLELDPAVNEILEVSPIPLFRAFPETRPVLWLLW
jgi:hypothetical protein